MHAHPSDVVNFMEDYGHFKEKLYRRCLECNPSTKFKCSLKNKVSESQTSENIPVCQ